MKPSSLSSKYSTYTAELRSRLSFARDSAKADWLVCSLVRKSRLDLPRQLVSRRRALLFVVHAPDSGAAKTSASSRLLCTQVHTAPSVQYRRRCLLASTGLHTIFALLMTLTGPTYLDESCACFSRVYSNPLLRWQAGLVTHKRLPTASTLNSIRRRSARKALKRLLRLSTVALYGWKRLDETLIARTGVQGGTHANAVFNPLHFFVVRLLKTPL